MRGATFLVGAVLVVFAAACASGRNAACDPETAACACTIPADCPGGYTCGAGGTCESISSPVDAGPDIDAPPGKDFGEPCGDKSECASNICILGGIGGICTASCQGGTCPPGFGCLGVLDAIEPGMVDDVCVPLATQLCSPCTQHTECAAIGQDLCLTNDLGGRFCGRDCSTVSCPAGYACQTETINGTSYRQCVPNSGYCDCVAVNQGMTQACTITTAAPFNTTCAGTRTCGGDAGWGACAPPSMTDDPDDAFTDANCDGIDGDVTRGVFVASAGSNTATCGLTATTPCQTIAYGVVRAAQSARVHVYVQTGTYNEVVPLVNGVSIHGGYDVTWQRGPYSNIANRVTIVGRKDDGAGGTNEFMTIRAHNASVVPVTIDNVVIQAPTATEAGKSSYAVHVVASLLTLRNVQVIGGNGANGTAGGAGLDASSLATAPMGGTGGAGDERTDCNGSARGAPGPKASNTCAASPSSRDMSGGDGGAGGTMDTSCPFDLDARPGLAGSYAAVVIGSAGNPGAGGPANSSGCNGGGGQGGGNGFPGAINNGGAGSAGMGGTLTSHFWSGNSGSAGGTGENGGGGGGAGGGGGCDDGTDAFGAGGGGGGAGGCAARGGGGGGTGAGGSFGVFAAASSSVTITSCSIARGNGGTGGAGGAGGRGQPGGLGGPGGSNPGSSPAGTGGRGGHGGHGGGGGGGAGGHSIGVAWTPGSTVTHSCTITGGAAGSGGIGGIAAPAVQGTFEDDGNDGPAGSAGVLADTRACASGTGC